EINKQWSEAAEWHSKALHIRRKVADARGTMQSYHALGKAALGQGDLPLAKAHLIQALRLATDLGEQLHQAKISHSLADLAAVESQYAKARAVVTHARKVYQKCGTSYDVAHADLSLCEFQMRDSERQAIVCRARGRAAVENRGFGLLRKVFPVVAVPL